MPQLLIEVCRKGNPVLLESASRPGCLGRFQLICCDYEGDTENGRFYSEKLWENCSREGSKMATRISERRAFGELDHPVDRLDSHLSCSAVNLVEFKKNTTDKTYVGTFDILDTPYGKMVKTYLDYGAKFGVSSRGAGDISMREGRQCVDEDTYDWEAFDVVLDPAVAKSKASVVESVQTVTLSKSLSDIIEECANPYELNMMKSLIENTDVPERDSLLESLNNKLSSYDVEGGATLSKLTEDLEKSLGKVADLESKNADLTSDLAASTTRVKVLEGTVGSLKTANLKLRSSATRSGRLYEESTEKLRNELSEARSALEVREDQITRLQTENSRIGSELRSTREELSKVSKELTESKTQLSKSRSAITESKNSGESLQKKLNESNATITARETTISKQNDQITYLRESSASILSSYIRLVARTHSLDEKELASKVKLEGKMTAESVDSIAKSMRDQSDRISMLPFDITKGTVVTESKTSTEDELSPELRQAARFAKALSRK